MIGLDLPLLFILVIRLVEQFSLKSSVYLYVLPDQQLVFWIFSFVLLMIYAVLRFRDRGEHLHLARIALIAVLGIFLIGSLLGIQVAARRATDPVLYTHDGAVQTEDAIHALKAGENPYAVDYRTRTFGSYPDAFSEGTRPNPAWSHYIYLPLQVVMGVPLAAAAERMIGWFDVRLLYLGSFIILAAAGTLLARDRERRILVLMLLLFNPLFTQFFAAGFNDVFFLGWIALGALMLQRGRARLGAVSFGLAVASKQSAWFVLPFYLAFVWFRSGGDMRKTMREILPGLITTLVIVLPFILWSPSNFFEDTIQYATGTAALSYPISGFGLGQLLLSMGVIGSMWDRYPFWIIQLAAGGPLLWWLWRWMKSEPTVSRMLAAYGMFTLVIWFTSRYFNDSYIGVISTIFLLSLAAAHHVKHQPHDA